MSLRGAVVIPAAPALLPGLGGTADPLRGVREIARGAVESLCATAPDASVVVVSGQDDGPTEWAWEAPSGAARFTTGRVSPGALPAGLEIGRMVLPEGRTARLIGIHHDASPRACGDLGRALVAEGPVVLVVVADGSATRTVKAPGHFDERAEAFDAEIARALAAVDAPALAELDPALASELWCRGRAALQVLAGAAEGSESPLRGQVQLDEAPYGVGYFVATWSA
ncbi:hypothetical protein [Janibacter sp. GXQ6167]|uniref:hypothetical protein n=1 Tax=Janibacter sp. GXQ6167 TaxID=3240791 RepID=UPI003525AD78